ARTWARNSGCSSPSLFVLGLARRSLPKIALHARGMKCHPEIEFLCHTGQHQDEKFSAICFRQIGIPARHISLGVKLRPASVKLTKSRNASNHLLSERKPGMALVVGGTSTRPSTR